MGLKWLWFCLVTAAAFFVTYECTKSLLGAGGVLAAPHVAPVTHMLAASLGEIVSVPVPHPPNYFFPSLYFFPPFTPLVNFRILVYLCWLHTFSALPFVVRPAASLLFHVLVFPLFVYFPPLHVPNERHQHTC